jgi:predicted metal-dependent enzyme (double-stranded beta helix superfamily)
VTIETFCKELDHSLTTVGTCEEKVRKTEALLMELTETQLPCCGQWDCVQGCYARHLVYHGEESGCCIVAMAWAPGQGTPVHDHDGIWCVECCLQGQLEVTKYELCDTIEEKDEPLYLFRPVETECVGHGRVGSLIPPFEHHVIRNPFEQKAITLHVYGKELLKSSCFEPLGNDRYRRVERKLAYASA